jgi:hypothetical protein
MGCWAARDASTVRQGKFLKAALKTVLKIKRGMAAAREGRIIPEPPPESKAWEPLKGRI